MTEKLDRRLREYGAANRRYEEAKIVLGHAEAELDEAADVLERLSSDVHAEFESAKAEERMRARGDIE